MTCPTCGAEVEAAARFCPACGSALTATCAACGALLPEGARFCPSCGAPVEAATGASGPEERKVVTVLFADVTGSTALGEHLDPERLRDVLATYFTAMREEIEAEGGTVEKFIGDAVMAAFGVPVAHEDDPGRALRAALRMLDRLDGVNRDLDAAHGVRLRIRIGVNTGDVIAATEPRPGEPMVTGDAVNTAQRLEAAAEPGSVLVAARTARAVRGFRFGSARELELKGKAGGFGAVPLLGRTGGPQRGVPGLSAPMVGRDPELEVLRSVYERVASEGRPHLVTIYGEPGVGKSRLVREFLSWLEAAERAPSVMFGRCLPYGDGVTYWPLAEILKTHSGITDSDPPEEVLRKVRGQCDVASLGAGEMSEDRACAALAYTIGVEDPAAPMAGREPRQVRREMHAAWRGFFTTLAADRPLVAVIEDIHWADPAMLDLLDEVAERAHGPVLFLCPARPTLLDHRPTWGGGRRNTSTIDLQPLSDDDADRLVSLLLSIDDLPRSTHRSILERAEGNPFFLEEIVRQLIDEEQIVFSEGRWRAAAGIVDVVIPDTVQGVLAARIDLLDTPDKRALQLAAVVGRVFWPAPVGLLLNGDRERLGEILDRLEGRDLVRSLVASTVAGEQEYAFKHVLTRDVAYETLPRRDRSRAHATVADWIDSAAPGRSEFVELLAYHLDAAFHGERDDPRGDPSRVSALRVRAFEATLVASEDARRRYAIAKALRLVERAQALAEAPLERALAYEQTGTTALNDYRGDLVWDSFRQAVAIRLEDIPQDATAIARACAYAVESPTRWPGSMSSIPPEDEVERYIQIGFDHIGEGDSIERVRLLTARAFAPFAYAPIRGTDDRELALSRRDGVEASEMAERLGRPDLASAALDGATSTGVIVGHYAQDIGLMERRIELLRGIDDPWEEGDAYAMVAWARACIGDLDRSLRYSREGRTKAEGAGADGIVIHLSAWDAYASFWLGDFDGVVETLASTEALLGDRRADPPYFTQNLYGSAALVASIRGDDVLRSRIVPIVEAMSAGRAGGSGAVAAGAWRAWIAARDGAHDEAASFLEQAQINTRGHWPVLLPAWAVALAEAHRWERVPAFLDEYRPWSEERGLRLLPPAFDRLEGQAALAGEEPAEAAGLLARAADAYGELGARWEKACTELVLAEALLAAGRADDARARLAAATPVFAELGSLLEIERAGALAARL